MTDFVDPLEEPYAADRAAATPPDAGAEEAFEARREAERREAENEAAETRPGPSPDAADGTQVTSASEGDALDPTTPVDNLE
ncbi:hypothetical protein [Agromyces archimandritae]|uniref:Uncharacterized protein n=1 Tax=Agromyces archimandritae TaxID=2781962 RepID=A0A975IMS0_9MICO|nr:hypothetical protein [Agromyces archimandritae]QTX03832.1 hypothetical protein G127AT_10930 [Agromyces archimandritae]